MRIRPLRTEDAPEWRQLRQLLWPETTEVDHATDLAEVLRAPESQAILVAEAETGVLAGFAEVRIRSHADGCATSPVGYLEGWFVDAAHRRRGVGRALVEAAQAWSAARGCRQFASDTHVDNSVSRAAHHALGFHEERPVVRLWKNLP